MAMIVVRVDVHKHKRQLARTVYTTPKTSQAVRVQDHEPVAERRQRIGTINTIGGWPS
jgi:hypothetical protein